MRRGAGYEGWLLKQGVAPDVAAEWAAHVVWAAGYAEGRWGRPLAQALRRPAHVRELARAAGEESAAVADALRAWCEWVLPPGTARPFDTRLHLRVVGG